MQGEIMIGTSGISLVLTVLLRMVYNTFCITNKYKPWIAVGLGMMLAGVGLYMLPAGEISTTMIIRYMEQGFMVGATATGMYEMSKGQGEK